MENDDCDGKREDKKCIHGIWRQGGDVGCGKHDVCIYFSDLKSLIRLASVRGNVINAYVVLLMEEQEPLVVGVEFSDKSYIISSICLDMLRSNNTNARDPTGHWWFMTSRWAAGSITTP